VTDIGITLPPFGYALLVLFVAAPWYLSGGAIGALLWRGLFVRRWWIGGLIGAVIGGLVWASTIPVW
jgi:hypothetical protein